MQTTHPKSDWSFAPRSSVEQVEEGTDLAPKFDANGVIPCIAQHAETGEILMFAYMNEEALRLTLGTGLAHYWSRSRGKLWRKGETSGMRQEVAAVLIDDDQDCVVLEDAARHFAALDEDIAQAARDCPVEVIKLER